jgi:hypothetical protein
MAPGTPSVVKKEEHLMFDISGCDLERSQRWKLLFVASKLLLVDIDGHNRFNLSIEKGLGLGLSACDTDDFFSFYCGPLKW